MINMDKLVEDARLCHLESKVTFYHGSVARRRGNTWRVEMLEMDAKFAADEAAVLFGKIMLITIRTMEIREFERSTGREFDARNMDVPPFSIATTGTGINHTNHTNNTIDTLDTLKLEN
jgi:hypothetical protein